MRGGEPRPPRRASASAIPSWRLLVDGDGGDENLKDYPIEENPELTIRSVVNNRMLYQEGWGVESIKHSLTYSGGFSRGCVRTYACAREHGFVGFSPYTRPAVIDVAEAIPFAELTEGSHERLYALKGEIVARGVRAVLGLDMPVFPKRRFQHGAVASSRASRGCSRRTRRCYRRHFQTLHAALGVSAIRRRSADPEPRVRPSRRSIRARRTGRSSRTNAGPTDAIERALTVFLTGAECPFTCSFCDLWRYDDRRADAGRRAAGAARGGARRARCIGAASRSAEAVQREQLLRPARRARRRHPARSPSCRAPFAGVTVESHASTVGAADARLRAALAGGSRSAIGLETIHPVAAAQLNKRLDLDAVRRGARAS